MWRLTALWAVWTAALDHIYILHPVSVLPGQDRQRQTGGGSEEGVLGAGALIPWGGGLSQPGERVALGAPSSAIAYQCLQEDGAELFIAMHGGEDKRQWAKLQQDTFSQGIRRRFFPHEDSQAGEQRLGTWMPAPSPEVFKTQADRALSSLVCPQSWPCFGRRFGVETSKVQPELFCDSLKVKGSVNHAKVSSWAIWKCFSKGYIRGKSSWVQKKKELDSHSRTIYANFNLNWIY